MPDFNGDGHDDILWWTGNAISNWLGRDDGGFLINDANALTPVDPGWYWEILGTGDFNGDGRSDILWIGDSSEITTSLATENGGFTGNGVGNPIPSSALWMVFGVGDFNDDGRDDLLWWNYNYSLATWSGTEDGGFTQNGPIPQTIGEPSWIVWGVGDFDGDGHDDLLWRNGETGALSDWLGNGDNTFTINDANAFHQVPKDWYIAGVGDFDGDGNSDILWRNQNGSLSNWLGTETGGFTINDANAFVVVPTAWYVAGVGDYDGDGRSDILWRNTHGAISNWLGTDTGGWVINDAHAYAEVENSWGIGSNWDPWDY